MERMVCFFCVALISGMDAMPLRFGSGPREKNVLGPPQCPLAYPPRIIISSQTHFHCTIPQKSLDTVIRVQLPGFPRRLTNYFPFPLNATFSFAAQFYEVSLSPFPSLPSILGFYWQLTDSHLCLLVTFCSNKYPLP